jgi:phenylacetate-CoA ligase
VQETVGRVRVLVVPSEHFGESEQERISLGLKQRLGSSVDVVIERVNTIPPERSGKHRYVVSHVAP